MSRLVLGFLILIFMTPAVAFEGTERRSMQLEWEAIDEAVVYELELVRHLPDDKRSKPLVFKVKRTQWTGKINPGRYSMRLRSIDARGVPGNWSEPSIVLAKAPAPELLVPLDSQEILTDQEETAEVEFRWKPSVGAENYRLEVSSPDGKIVQQETLDATSKKLSLPVANKFRWRVVPVMQGEEDGESVEQASAFTLIGKKLKAPDIATPATRYVTQVDWEKSDLAKTYSYTLMRQDKGSWKTVEKKRVQKNELRLNPRYPGGLYRLEVVAEAPLREASPESRRDFEVWDGLRTPAGIEQALMIESIEKPSRFYSVASYFITQVNYQGNNRETGTPATYDALGGVGRIGLGYTPQGSKWGGLGIADLSGFTLGSKNFVFAAVEAHLTHRRYLRGSNQLLLSGGLAYRELPFISGNSFSGTFDVDSVKYLAPHVGFTFWHPINRRYGLQVNGRAYYGVTSLHTPNNQAPVGAVSYFFGALASYRLNHKLTGFVGYSYKEDNAAFKAVAGDANDPNSTSLAEQGQSNTSSLTGHYLNLALEFAF